MAVYQRRSQGSFPLYYLINACLLCLVCVIAPNGVVMADKFTESGLMNIPTGDVLRHGTFGVGTHIAFQNSSRLLRDETALRLNFGMFDRGEIGLSYLWYQSFVPDVQLDNGDATLQLAALKVQLVKEKEPGMIPGVAIGVENLKLAKAGPSTLLENPVSRERAAFLVVSKTFNLPRIHLISGHIGLGTARFAPGDFPVGLFAGMSTEFHPVFAKGDITLSVEFDGISVNAAMRHIAASGLQTTFGVESLSNPEELRYFGSVSWTNERIIEQIAETKRLVMQGAKGQHTEK